MRRIYWLVLLAILILGFFVRLYRFDNPIADWHSWRQVDTSAVSRNFVKNGYDVLHPKFDDLSNVPSGIDNPQGLRFVEFPLLNIKQAFLYKTFGIITLEEWGRLVIIFESILSIVFIFFIVKKHSTIAEALLSSFFFAFLPFSIYYSRAILPDELMVTFILGGILFFDLWSEGYKEKKSNQWIYFILSILFTSGAFLAKPYALIFTLPIIYLTISRFGYSFIKKWQLWVFLFITVTPLLLWRNWMQQFPEGVPVSNWLFNGGNIRFKGAFFYWIFAERISKLILGYFGVVFLIVGVIKRETEKSYFFFISFLVSSLLYLTIIARGNVQHDYYQILIIPTIAIFLSRGVYYFISNARGVNKYISYVIIFTVSVFMFSFSWFQVRDYFNINNWGIIEAGKEADKILPKDALVIAPYDGDTTFLYQTNRRGWAAFEKSIDEMIKMGASYLVIANPTPNDFSGFGTMYESVASSSSYLILKLK